MVNEMDIDKKIDDLSNKELLELFDTIVNLRKLDLSFKRTTDEELKRFVDLYPKLEVLNVGHSRITYRGVQYLSKLVNLKELKLCSGGCIHDNTLIHLKNLVNLEKLDLGHNSIRGEGFKHLKKLTKLRKLDLKMTDITDKGLKYFKNLINLKELNLSRTNISGEGLQYLKDLNLEILDLYGHFIRGGLKYLQKMVSLKKLILSRFPTFNNELLYLKDLINLKELILWYPTIKTDVLAPLEYLVSLEKLIIVDFVLKNKDLRFLKKLTNLRELRLGDTKDLTNDALVYLENATQLKVLELHNVSLKGIGFVYPNNLPNLEELILRGRKFTDEGLWYFNALKWDNLHTLELSRTGITDKGLSCISNLTSLQTLDLFDTQITNEGLKYLKPLTNLNWLDMRSTKVTRKGVDRYLNHLNNTGAVILVSK